MERPASPVVVVPSPRSLAVDQGTVRSGSQIDRPEIRNGRLRYNRSPMSRDPDQTPSRLIEGLHASGLSAAAGALLVGLLTRQAVWVDTGVSLILLLPPLRLATTIFGEAHARRYGVAAMGLAVLAFLLFSRRVS